LHRKRVAQLVVLFFNINLALAQNFEPKGNFIETETKIGEEISYTLSVGYNKTLTYYSRIARMILAHLSIIQELTLLRNRIVY